MGVALTKPLNTFYSKLEEKLKSGHSIKVLMVHPDPAVVEFSEIRSYTRTNIERACNNIKDSLADFCELKKIAPNLLTIKTVRHPLGHGLVAINPDSVAGTLYVSNYPFKTKGGSLPKFVIHARDGRWYSLFREELNKLWDYGEEWECQ